MGASGYQTSGNNAGHADKLDGTSNISGPGPPRRWSVPEANDPPNGSGVNIPSTSSVATMWAGLNPWIGGAGTFVASKNTNIGVAFPWQAASGVTPEMLDGSLGAAVANSRRLSVPAAAVSRDSSAGGTRSNSHSRSATPGEDCIIPGNF